MAGSGDTQEFFISFRLLHEMRHHGRQTSLSSKHFSLQNIFMTVHQPVQIGRLEKNTLLRSD